jgi:hypothetical protein
MLPHEWFAALWQNHPEQAQSILFGTMDSAAVLSWWHHLRGWPGYPRAARGLDDDALSLCCPLGLHGDGVAVTAVRSAYAGSALCLNVFSVLARGPTASFNHVLALLWESSVVPGICPCRFRSARRHAKAERM